MLLTTSLSHKIPCCVSQTGYISKDAPRLFIMYHRSNAASHSNLVRALRSIYLRFLLHMQCFLYRTQSKAPKDKANLQREILDSIYKDGAWLLTLHFSHVSVLRIPPYVSNSLAKLALSP